MRLVIAMAGILGLAVTLAIVPLPRGRWFLRLLAAPVVGLAIVAAVTLASFAYFVATGAPTEPLALALPPTDTHPRSCSIPRIKE